MASSHDATGPCDLLQWLQSQGLVPSCVPTLSLGKTVVSHLTKNPGCTLEQEGPTTLYGGLEVQRAYTPPLPPPTPLPPPHPYTFPFYIMTKPERLDSSVISVMAAFLPVFHIHCRWFIKVRESIRMLFFYQVQLTFMIRSQLFCRTECEKIVSVFLFG